MSIRGCGYRGVMSTQLPIHSALLHYADPAINDEAQISAITPFVDRIHYPTLGAPALLTPQQCLQVMLSLPHGDDPSSYSLLLVARHAGPKPKPEMPISFDEDGKPSYSYVWPGEEHGRVGGVLSLLSSVRSLGVGPQGKAGIREAWLLECSIQDVSPRLYDLQLRRGTEIVETQCNAVRVFKEITGKERVIFCGDIQFHDGNQECLDRFIARINSLDEIAWVAIIGDICDNGVKKPSNAIRLATEACAQPVRTYYHWEYAEAHRRLATLNKPIVLVPGNHDGMAANELYGEGTPSSVYLGNDPQNEVAYDGLHYFRRTFGPLYHSFRWHNTSYICLNSFELDRQQRLGFHCVVANWGGWLRDEQTSWLREELSAASKAGLHKMVLVHNDLRGGSKGKFLGEYSEYRPYRYQDASRAALSYFKYALTHIRSFQQEWMWWKTESLAAHPVRNILALLLEHKVWNVVMGHDDENWVESYQADDNVFAAKPKHQEYAPPLRNVKTVALVSDASDLMLAGKIKDALDLLDSELANETARAKEDMLAAVIERVASSSKPAPAMYGTSSTVEWNLRASEAIHFVHVNDIGGYDHDSEKDFATYGYVIAQLDEGRPISLQGFNLGNVTEGALLELVKG